MSWRARKQKNNLAGGSVKIRTGLGWDRHRLVSGRPLVLGGVIIPSDTGEDGHSDGDVLLHAITDALLGAAGLGDIGELFPPSNPAWKNADSRTLLADAWALVQAKGWHLINIDCIIALERPKFLPWRTQVRTSVAAVLSVDVNRIFVKAKTGEGLAPVGTGEAIECWASCLISEEVPE